MKSFLEKACENEEFLNCLGTQSEAYIEWQITAVFYCAYHFIKALADHRGIEIGTDHQTINGNLNPRKKDALMPLKPHVWNSYYELYKYSKVARYDLDNEEEDLKNDLQECHKHLLDIKIYVEAKGVDIEGFKSQMKNPIQFALVLTNLE
jgi:hypothetical protein